MEHKTLRVLVVEDNPNDYGLITHEITASNGFMLYSERVETERDLRRALHTQTWDIIISDFNLPKLDAVRVLAVLEELGLDMPFILVSGVINEERAGEVLSDKRVHEFVSKDNLRRLAAVFHREIETNLAYDQTLTAWARALEYRDRETAGHSQRVTDLTVKLARRLTISETEIVNIRRGAMLHDIGKMAVSDSILQKPDKLTEEEFERMKRHPQIAYDLLLPIKRLRRSLDIPYCHHEKYDGTGYPRGLKGGEIPTAARIFSVVDVYDAMTSDRPYRSKLSKNFTLRYIKDQKRMSFDPMVADTFIEMMNEN